MLFLIYLYINVETWELLCVLHQSSWTLQTEHIQKTWFCALQLKEIIKDRKKSWSTICPPPHLGNHPSGRALQWQKNVKIIVQNMVIHPIIYNDVCKFTSHKLFWPWMPWGKKSNTYSKCKVRSVERIACFNSCIMLLYSLELRFAKILWPCEIKTQ